MPDLTALPPFPGFREEGFAFLRQLEKHNERDWFKPRKSTYEDELKGPLECLIADVARRMADEGLPLTGDPRSSGFRIYRDVRFSNDKRPYKTHISALFDRSGSKDAPGIVYVHIEPENSFLSAGFYQLSARYLRPVRQRMAEQPGAFFSLLEKMEARGLPVTPRSDTLTGMPQGFSDYRDSAIAEHLKWQSFLVRRDVPESELATPAFSEEVVRLAEESLPLLSYVWSAHET